MEDSIGVIGFAPEVVESGEWTPVTNGCWGPESGGVTGILLVQILRKIHVGNNLQFHLQFWPYRLTIFAEA